MKQLLEKIIKDALDKAIANNYFIASEIPPILLEIPKSNIFGDYTTNIAMLIASRISKNPREVANSIIKNIEDTSQLINKIEVAGPGFINIFINPKYWLAILKEIEIKQEMFGSSDIGKGCKVHIEFVSANPTGPLHVGHARGAVVGDVLTNLLKTCGYTVLKEYYINDAGNQMKLLGLSCIVRYKQKLGQDIPFLDNGYQGEYIIDIAQDIIKKYGDKFINIPENEVLPFFIEYTSNFILNKIKFDLKRLGVTFDNWFSETSLYKSGEVQETIERLKKEGYTYEKENAIWMKTSAFGDEKDRVIVRQNGEPTYYASDIAYHIKKFSQGFDIMINIWGADHHGYVNRIKAIIEVLGYAQSKLKVILIQLVNLLRGDQKVGMSKRAGEFHTLAEVLDEVGSDSIRFSFLTRRSDSHLDFDLEVAKKQSMENPVYYVQYAHARICSILEEAKKQDISLPLSSKEVALDLLILPEEVELNKLLSQFPDLVKTCTTTFEPHRLTFYLQELASHFHKYYNHHRIISSKDEVIIIDENLTQARLYFIAMIRVVLQNALFLLGITPKEKMKKRCD
ncbi:MAG: arginine--tRNA ligase [bacterium]